MKNSTQLWNNREAVKKTKKEWDKFKIDWDNDLKYDFTRISVFVGQDESKLNFGWYSTKEETPIICWSTTKDMSKCKEIPGTYEKYYKLMGKQYYSNKVTVTGLKRNSVYYYTRIMNGKKEETYTFKTYDEDNFNFIFVGDPQIGGSHGRISFKNGDPYILSEEDGTRNDAFNWNRTVHYSVEFTKTPSVFLSAGDQADEENYVSAIYEDYVKTNEESYFIEETQYSAFLLPKELRTIPVAATVGNHDAYTENFRRHFNTPNSYTTPSYLGETIIPGYNYFFKYNNVLVVVLESNYGSCEDYNTVVKKAIKKYPDMDWRIGMFHHDIYGNGMYHFNETRTYEVLRPCLTKLFSENEFDLVINGHDHVYAASKFISYNDQYRYGESKEDELYTFSGVLRSDITYTNPRGTLYITANCSSGSKLYNYIYPDPNYIGFYNQTYSSTFGTIDFKREDEKVKMEITTREVEGYRVVDGPYIIEKNAKKKVLHTNQESINYFIFIYLFLHYTIFYYIILYYTIFYYIILYYIILFIYINLKIINNISNY